MQMDELSNWIECSREAAKIIAHRSSIDLGKVDIQAALMTVLNLERPTDLLSEYWSVKKMLALTEGIDFKAWSEHEQVVLYESILPPSVSGRLDEQTIRVKGELWRIHKYDPDDFPSVPHAVNMATGLKLDLRNGKLYRKRQLLDRLNRRDLERLRSRVRLIELPPLEA
jgi:hypothetical protein